MFERRVFYFIPLHSVVCCGVAVACTVEAKCARVVQGGRFDHADRLFTSLPRAWAQVLKNSSDVKEMIPEFFYQPAFLALSLIHI